MLTGAIESGAALSLFPITGCIVISLGLLYSEKSRKYLLYSWRFGFLLAFSAIAEIRWFFIVLFLGPWLLLLILGFEAVRVIANEYFMLKPTAIKYQIPNPSIKRDALKRATYVKR